jgi:hypothetical protein
MPVPSQESGRPCTLFCNLCVRDIDFVLYDFSIGFRNCSDCVWYVLFFYWLSELFRLCVVCFVFLLAFGIVPTVCSMFCFSIGFQNCSDCVYCGMFFYFITKNLYCHSNQSRPGHTDIWTMPDKPPTINNISVNNEPTCIC